MFLIFYAIFLQITLTLNEETGCSCGTNRAGGEVTTNKFSSISKSLDQCPGEQNNLIDSMVLIPTGEYQFGTDDIAIESDKEGPKRIVKLDSFYLDKYEVSNKDFGLFVKLTDYKTEAEIFGDSFVFTAFLNNTFKDQLKDFRVVQAVWWYKVLGANWNHPYGPDSDLKDFLDHPVVHVSWSDAQAFCKWRGARLPTEAEWEAACRGGHRDTKYPWGDKLFPGRKHMANIWQGTFPDHNSAKDGYVGTNPVNMYPPNDFGVYNMAGNVWEWTDDPWTKNDVNEKVKKGGSYLCHKSYCYRYRCSSRSHNTQDSSAGNLGFRCAKSV